MKRPLSTTDTEMVTADAAADTGMILIEVAQLNLMYCFPTNTYHFTVLMAV